MTFFVLLGLVAASIPCALFALAGLFQMLFNDIGGAGTRASALFGLAMLLVGSYAVYWLWSRYSPVIILVAP